MTTVTRLITCWVFGDDPDRCVFVKMPLNKNVADLKKAIKQEKMPALDHLPADKLQLYKVSVLFDEHFEEQVNTLNLTTEHRLSPRTKLHSLFLQQSGDDYLDLVVKVFDGKLEYLNLPCGL